MGATLSGVICRGRTDEVTFEQGLEDEDGESE